jgi:hypothetical protein
VRRRGEGETVSGRRRAGAAREEEGEADRRKKTGADGWVPPVSRRKREKAGALVERAAWAGSGELGRGRKKRGGRGKWAAGRLMREREEGEVCFFSFSFFKSFLKLTFKSFQIQIFTQLFSKLFTNLFTIILKDFSQILLKTFKTTQQQNSCIPK